MKPFDLVFIAVFLFVTGWVVRIAIQLLRGRREAARRQGLRLTAFVAAYLGVEIAVSLATPQRVLAVGETRRFDDWCIAVTGAETADRVGAFAAGEGRFVLLGLRVFSEARRVSQAAPEASVHLLDAAGRRYDVDPAAQAAYERLHGPQTPLGARLEPLGSFTTVRVFRVPSALDHVDVVTPHGSGPGAFIIGDDASLLHKPTVVRVPLGR